MGENWVHDGNAALLTDFYQLTMLQSYSSLGMNDVAVFDLFVRRLPPERNYLIACGLEDVLHYLETVRFSEESLDYLRGLGGFSEGFLDYLRDFRFSGDVYAAPEGSVVFANEPILEVVAPLPEAQLVETFLMNQVHHQTMAASKASRIVTAAASRRIVDFGLRRMHGADAGVKGARAFYIAGIDATSNVLAAKLYGIPVAGTMAHSYIQAHPEEVNAFRSFIQSFPATILLVDTYDTLAGVQRVVQLARELGADFRVRGIRLDSGDLEKLSKESRRILDDAGLQRIEIFASSSLDEYAIRDLVRRGAPIAGFGVGVHMAVSSDAPYLDTAYKLVEYAGVPRIKLSENKRSLPGRKQVFRQDGRDVIALHHERLEGTPLLIQVMAGGRTIHRDPAPAHAARDRRAGQMQALPERLLDLDAVKPYPVELSGELAALESRLRHGLTGG